MVCEPSHMDHVFVLPYRRYEERIQIIQTKVTPQMRQLQQFKGLIGSPVNHDNVHWGLLILDRKGKPFYYDSLSRKVDKRIRLMAQCVPRLYHILILLSRFRFCLVATPLWTYGDSRWEGDPRQRIQAKRRYLALFIFPLSLTSALGWECGIHTTMLVETLLHGADFPFDFREWDDDLVEAVDRRYAGIINGPRVHEVPLYIAPSQFEQERGFCQGASVDVASIRSQAVEDVRVARAEGFYLMKVRPEMMSSRDNLTGHHIAVNWENSGTWYIGLVLGPRNRSFTVRWFVDRSETVIRLRHFGFTKKTGGQDWRLVSRNSALFDIQDGHSRGMT